MTIRASRQNLASVVKPTTWWLPACRPTLSRKQTAQNAVTC